jgi:hypothetical protein
MLKTYTMIQKLVEFLVLPVCVSSSPEFFNFFVGVLMPEILAGELISVFLFCPKGSSLNISTSLGPLITGKLISVVT